MSRGFALQICNGLGAGNIGDETMARAFWNTIPADLALEVDLFQESARQHAGYPTRHLYRPVEWSGNSNLATRDIPGLLVGDTPVTDAEGLHWPMQFLAPRLQHFHDQGQPVDAVGVGVDGGLGDNARRLFHDHFLPIRSWTVRSSSCKNALLALGVPESNVHVGADWAWLYKPGSDRRDWAQALWRNIGIDPQGPLIVVNVVNLQWRDRIDLKRALASALDRASEQFGLQVAFFCNDSRCGDMFDYAAALEVLAWMQSPASVVPNEYYSPDEAIALLNCATVALGERYHFLVESVLAGCVPVGALRGEKMQTLASELAIPVAGMAESLDKEGVTQSIQQALENRAEILCRLRETRDQLERRAMDNLIFVRRLAPYADARWQGE